MQKIPQEIRKEWEDLIQQIRLHDRLYYKEDAPIISDVEYDILRKRLEFIEKHFPALEKSTSPTQEVGAQAASGFHKIHHLQHLYSLDNAFNDAEIKKFLKRTKKFFGNI